MRIVNTAAPSTNRAERHPSSVALHRQSVRSTIEAAAISELARRTLRSNGLVIHNRNPASLGANDFSLMISDHAAGLVLSVAIENSDSEGIVIELLDSPGGIIAASEPADMRVVWIPGDSLHLWNRFKDTVLRLAVAGYPGCVGCAGPAAELPWDEEASRLRLR